MLCFLRIRGLALLDDVSLELASGLNVLTGETGAGKSIIVDALSLLRGAKLRTEIIRSGEEQTTVDAQFELPKSVLGAIDAELELAGIESQKQELIIQRTLPRNGRGRQFINAQLTTRNVLESVGASLVDICSQHEHQSLASVGKHIEFLDGFAGAEELLQKYGEHYAGYKKILAERQVLVERAREAAEKSDFLRYQIDEWERLSPEPGELETLKAKVSVLRNSQRWAEFSEEAEQTLYEGEDSVSMRLTRLLDRARRGSEDSPKLAELADQLATALASCDDALDTVRRFASDLDVEPGALERAEERLHELTQLQRKHGGDIEDLASRLVAMKRDLEQYAKAEQHLSELDVTLDREFQRCVALAEQLREARRKASRGLAKTVESELAALHIPHARFEAHLEVLPREELSPRGLDRVEFLFSANAGEPLAPLTRVASGGELSRVLLAIRGALAGEGAVATYVFDEIDAGVGGAVAESIGLRLARAAASNQVLCITHLPQIAAFADAHFRVEKLNEGGRTMTRVKKLSPDEHVEELARMLGGARVTESARAHAKQLIEEATRARSNQSQQAKVASAKKGTKRA